MNRQWLGIATGVLVGIIVAGAIGAAPVKTASPVEVVNFPQVQGIGGTVNVGNLPAVQSVDVLGEVAVAGVVDVGNLPLDANGHLQVACTSAPPQPIIQFAGYTTATFAEGTGLLALNRACQAEFPRTRVCRGSELVDMIPAPPVILPNQGGDPSQPGYAFLISFGQQVVAVGSTENGAAIPFSSCMSALGRPFDCGALPLPIGCCGF